jgi:hypothetical protein
VTVTGSLTWTKVKAGASLAGGFQVQNSGDADSLLNWTVDASMLTWGTWTFTPHQGTNLTPQEGTVNVMVTCIIPDEKNTDFSGWLRVVNTDDQSDFATVPVCIQTPYNPPHLFPRLWQWFAYLFEIMQEIHHR